MQYCVVDEYGIVLNIILADEKLANAMNLRPIYDGVQIGEEYDPLLTTNNKIRSLEAENKILKAQLQAQGESHDFLEDCIAEMAQIVYSD